MDTQNVLSELKRRILSPGGDKDARNELNALTERFIKGDDTTGDSLTDKLLYIYETLFVREEEHILSVHKELEQNLLGHVGEPVMLAQAVEKLVDPRDTADYWTHYDSKGSYLVYDYRIKFGILSAAALTCDECYIHLATDGHVAGSSRDKPDAFKIVSGGIPIGYFWRDRMTHVVIGDSQIKEWFRKRERDPGARLVGLYSYMRSLLGDETYDKCSQEAASSIHEIYKEIEALEEKRGLLESQIVVKLNSSLQLGIFRSNPTLYDRINYWQKYWPPHPFPKL